LIDWLVVEFSSSYNFFLIHQVRESLNKIIFKVLQAKIEIDLTTINRFGLCKCALANVHLSIGVKS